jgi:hypothetical protein
VNTQESAIDFLRENFSLWRYSGYGCRKIGNTAARLREPQRIKNAEAPAEGANTGSEKSFLFMLETVTTRDFNELGKVKEGGRNGVKPGDGGSPLRRVAPELREQV